MSDRTLSTRVPTDRLPDANHLKLSVYYDKAGINYATYKSEPGGYWASINPVEVSTDGPFLTETYHNMVTNPLAGKIFLTPATRFNRNLLKKLADKVLPLAASLVEPLATGRRDVVMELVKGAVA